MKRIVFLLVIALAMAGSVFAQGGFTVQSVTGRVQREAGNNRVDVVVGDVLSANTVVHTGIGASLVLREGARTFTVPAAQNGKMISDLITAGSSVRISGNVTTVDTAAVSRTTGQVATASARASDVAADDDIAAE
jgi:hypothetical protein